MELHADKRCACGAPRRSPGQSNCRACHALAQRRHRRALSPEQRARANARSYLGVYLRRGKVKREPCAQCGAEPAEAHRLDYREPLRVVWLCRPHRVEARNKVRAQERAQAREQASANPAEVVRDLLTNREHGLGLSLSAEEERALDEMRSVCAEEVGA